MPCPPSTNDERARAAFDVERTPLEPLVEIEIESYRRLEWHDVESHLVRDPVTGQLYAVSAVV